MDWIRDHLWETWLALSIALGVAEMFSLDLILAMLAAVATSVAMIALVRPSVVKRLHTGPELALGHGKLVGTRGMVTEEITGLSPGRIKAAGEIWSALPYDENLRIAAGETVEILEIRGATAYVHPVATLEP